MARPKETGKNRSHIPIAPVFLFLLLLAGPWLAGCSGIHNKSVAGGTKNDDPLFGPIPSKGPGSPVEAPAHTSDPLKASPTTTTTAGGIPTNSSLAAGPLPDSRPLAIGNNQGSGVGWPATLTSGSKGPGGTNLGRPQPIVQPVPRANDIQTTGSWNTSNNPSDPFLKELLDRGVTYRKADMVGNQVKFSCIVPRRDNPRASRIFEATAPDISAAVRAVLQQIDADSRK